MNLRTMAGWAAVAYAAWFLIEQPANAGHIIHNIGSFLAAAGVGLAHFLGEI